MDHKDVFGDAHLKDITLDSMDIYVERAKGQSLDTLLSNVLIRAQTLDTDQEQFLAVYHLTLILFHVLGVGRKEEEKLIHEIFRVMYALDQLDSQDIKAFPSSRHKERIAFWSLLVDSNVARDGKGFILLLFFAEKIYTNLFPHENDFTQEATARGLIYKEK